MRGVKPRFTSLRSFVWRGASMLIIEPKNSSSSTGRSPMLEPRPEMKLSESRETRWTSSWRTTDQNPGPLGKPMNSGSSWNDTGRSARSFAKMPSRSVRDQISGAPSWMSSARRSVVGIDVTCVLLAATRSGRPQLAQHEAEQVAAPERRPAREDVVTGFLDAREHRQTSVGEEADLAPEAALHQRRQSEPALEPGPCAIHLERHEGGEARRQTSARQGLAAAGEAVEVLLGQVDATAFQILGHVLPAVGELQGGADLVGARLPFRIVVPEEPEHDAADRVRGAPAVLEQVRERRHGPRLAGRVAPEGRQEVAERLDRQAVRRDGVAEGEKDRIIDRSRIGGAGQQPLLVSRQAGEPSLRISLVCQIVAAACEGVDGGEVAPQPAWQEEGADREVLVVGAGDAAALRVGALESLGHAADSARDRYWPSARSGYWSAE